MRQLIVDTETTGLDPVLGHRIIEFAALEMIDRKLTGHSLHLYINPERAIDPAAIKIHGIKDEDVLDKPVFKDIVKEIIAYIAGAELIIHNAKFDLNFMDYQFKLEGMGPTDDYTMGVTDTLLMARQKFPGSKNSLDALCDRFSIDRSNRDYHGALIDCHLLAYVYLALTREQISLLNSEIMANTVENYQFVKVESTRLNLKVLSPTPEEAKLHTDYLSTLDKLTHGQSAWFNKIKNS